MFPIRKGPRCVSMALMALHVVTVCGADRVKLLSAGQHVASETFSRGRWLRRPQEGVERNGTELSEIDGYSAKWGLRRQKAVQPGRFSGGPGFSAGWPEKYITNLQHPLMKRRDSFNPWE